MTDIEELNKTKVTVVITPSTPDTFSSHVMVTYCDFFKRPDSQNQHCVGNGINFTDTVSYRQRHRGKSFQTSYKSNTNFTDLFKRKIFLT